MGIAKKRNAPGLNSSGLHCYYCLILAVFFFLAAHKPVFLRSPELKLRLQLKDNSSCSSSKSCREKFLFESLYRNFFGPPTKQQGRCVKVEDSSKFYSHMVNFGCVGVGERQRRQCDSDRLLHLNLYSARPKKKIVTKTQI